MTAYTKCTCAVACEHDVAPASALTPAVFAPQSLCHTLTSTSSTGRASVIKGVPPCSWGCTVSPLQQHASRQATGVRHMQSAVHAARQAAPTGSPASRQAAGFRHVQSAVHAAQQAAAARAACPGCSLPPGLHSDQVRRRMHPLSRETLECWSPPGHVWPPCQQGLWLEVDGGRCRQ